MRRLIHILIFGLLVLLPPNAIALQKYTVFQHRLFIISVPSTWHSISKEYLNNFFAEQAKKHGLEVNQDWLRRECGFQEKPLATGLSLPLITLKVDTNKRISTAILQQINTMTNDQLSIPYSKFVKILTSDIQGIIDPSAKIITLNRKKKMLRFTIEMNNVLTLSSIYVSDDKLFHIICTTAKNSNRNLNIFKYVSDSFKMVSVNISTGANRGDLSVSQALIGSWQPTKKTWLGFGKDQLSETTLHQFNPNGIYILIQGSSTKQMPYIIREKNEHENWVIIYVRVPESGKGHIKVIEFLPDKTSAKVETHWSYTNVRKKQKNVVSKSTWYFVDK